MIISFFLHLYPCVLICCAEQPIRVISVTSVSPYWIQIPGVGCKNTPQGLGFGCWLMHTHILNSFSASSPQCVPTHALCMDQHITCVLVIVCDFGLQILILFRSSSETEAIELKVSDVNGVISLSVAAHAAKQTFQAEKTGKASWNLLFLWHCADAFNLVCEFLWYLHLRWQWKCY